MKKEIIKTIFLIGIILIASFVLAEELEPVAFGDIVGTEDGTVVNGIGHTKFNDAEISEFGGTDALTIQSEGASFTDNEGNEFSYVDSEKMNRFVFDKDGNMVSCEFTVGGDEPVECKLGGTIVKLNPGERLEFKNGEINIFEVSGNIEPPSFSKNQILVSYNLKKDSKVNYGEGIEISDNGEGITIFNDGLEHDELKKSYVSIGENNVILRNFKGSKKIGVSLKYGNSIIEGGRSLSRIEASNGGTVEIERFAGGIVGKISENGAIGNYNARIEVREGEYFSAREGTGESYFQVDTTQSSALVIAEDRNGNNLLGEENFGAILSNDGSVMIADMKTAGTVMGEKGTTLTEPRVQDRRTISEKIKDEIKSFRNYICSEFNIKSYCNPDTPHL